MRLLFFHIVLFVLVALSSCSSSNLSVPSQTSNTSETCYLNVTAKREYDEFSVLSFSISLISRFHRRVLEPPFEGLSANEKCVYEVSVDSRDFTTVVTISGSDLNTSGDSKQSGMDGLQESILRALLNGLPNKKDQICESYGEKLVECGVDRY